MNTRDNGPLHAAINAKLSAIVAASGQKPSWYDDWMQLGPETTELERLRVYQAIRDTGDLPVDAGFYLVSWQMSNAAQIPVALAERLARRVNFGPRSRKET